VFTAAGATREKGVVVPLYRDTLRLETELPQPSPGVWHIVDYDVALACIGSLRSRHDLLVPNGGVVDPATGVLHVASLAIAGLLAWSAQPANKRILIRARLPSPQRQGHDQSEHQCTEEHHAKGNQ
jgi:hypothetical protein